MKKPSACKDAISDWGDTPPEGWFYCYKSLPLSRAYARKVSPGVILCTI